MTIFISKEKGLCMDYLKCALLVFKFVWFNNKKNMNACTFLFFSHHLFNY